MPVNPLAALETRTMTEVINNRYKPRLPLTVLLFGDGVRQKNLTTETVQLDTLVGSYEMAPFVKKDGVPMSISRKNFDSVTLETPCMKLAMPLTDSDELLQRRAGQADLGVGDSDPIRQAMIEQIVEDMDAMVTAEEWRVEWMISQLLQGTISYENEDTGAAFTIGTNKPVGNTITVSPLWDQEAATPLKDIAEAVKVTVDANGPAPTLALCGANAADAIRDRMEKGWMTSLNTQNGIEAGSGTLVASYNELGLCFLGRFGGIDFWEVRATMTVPETGQVPVIRADYIEFIPNSKPGKDDRTMFNGRKRGASAALNGTAVGKLFARSYIDEVKDVYMQELQWRPLPWIKHPNWYVSMKVI